MSLLRMRFCYGHPGGELLLAALRHQCKSTILLVAPVATDVRVHKMLVSDWFDVLNVDDLTKSTRVNNLFHSNIERRISKNFIILGYLPFEEPGAVGM